MDWNSIAIMIFWMAEYILFWWSLKITQKYGFGWAA